MTQITDYIQTTYENTLDDFVAGQIANTLPAKCESGSFESDNTDGTNLPFGYACQWVDENQVRRGAARAAIGHVTEAASSGSTLKMALRPGVPRPAVGTEVIIGTAIRTITAVATNDDYTVDAAFGSGNNSIALNAPVHVLNGGRTTFAGVAVRNVALPATNTPVDTYNAHDIVTVGSEGDYVVVCDGTVSRGDNASVYIGNTAADKGKFSNSAEATGNSGYVGIPGAVFMTDSQSINSVNLAVLRITKQSS